MFKIRKYWEVLEVWLVEVWSSAQSQLLVELTFHQITESFLKSVLLMLNKLKTDFVENCTNIQLWLCRKVS